MKHAPRALVRGKPLFNGGSENQMMEDGQTVSSLMAEYNAKAAAKRKAEDEEQARLLAVAANGGSGGGVLSAARSFTESKPFLGVEAGLFLLTLALVDGAWSGDWVRYDYISEATEQYMKSCSLQIAFAHVCLASLGGVLLEAKGRTEGQGLQMLRTLLVGGIDFARVALMRSKEEEEAVALAAAPPLSMEISTFQMASTKAVDGVLLSTNIRTLPGKEGEMRQLLTHLMEQSKDEKVSRLLSTFAVNQDGDDRRNFWMLQRFPSIEKMKTYQNSAAFKDYTTKAFPLLAEPFGLYITNERKGRLSEPNYPFGPGGEGGRDDAIYSSPTNLDGSQGGAFAKNEAGKKKENA